MKKTAIVGYVCCLLLMVVGCASKHMTIVDESSRVTRPAPGKALVYFIRNTTLGGAIQASLFDGDMYIGTISAMRHIAYQADPGKHLFMVIGESADFMQAELIEGKMYYAYVVPRTGVWKARFSFRPQNGQIDQNEIDKDIRSLDQIVANEVGKTWAEENANSIRAYKGKYLPEWEQKSEHTKQILHAASGK